MPEITCRILDSISKISKADWQHCFAEIPEGYGFYQTLEDAGLKEFSFYYLLLYREGKLIAIAPLFLADFDLAIATEGLSRRLIKAARKLFPRFLVFRTLFCGSPFGEQANLGLSRDCSGQGFSALNLAAAMEEFALQQKASLVIFKDFPQAASGFLDSLVPEGYFKVKSFPSAITETKFSDFEQYLASLSHSSRKGLRRKLKKAQQLGKVEVKVSDSLGPLIDEAFKLYENTYHSGSTKFERLTKEFFRAVSVNMRPNAKFFLYYCDGRLGAFNLCFIYPDLFIDKFIGFDYDISHKFHLYFISWCYNIQWCIEQTIPRYQSGQTDYGPKESLGGKLIDLYMYLKHTDRTVYSLLKLISRWLKPKS